MLKRISNRYFAFGLVPKQDHTSVMSPTCLFVLNVVTFRACRAFVCSWRECNSFGFSSLAVLSVVLRSRGMPCDKRDVVPVPSNSLRQYRPPHPCSLSVPFLTD